MIGIDDYRIGWKQFSAICFRPFFYSSFFIHFPLVYVLSIETLDKPRVIYALHGTYRKRIELIHPAIWQHLII